MWHQYPSVRIIHYSTMSHHTSTKMPSKNYMVVSFLRRFPRFTGSCSCYLEQLFCGEQVTTCFCRNDSIREHFLEIFCKFQRTFNIFCKEFVFSGAVNCWLWACMELWLKGDFSEFLEELLFGTYQYTSWRFRQCCKMQKFPLLLY